MKKSQRDSEVSERLRQLTERKFGYRGRFTLLEDASGIKASRWKNFYYRKQEATKEILDFWINKYPEDEIWLMTGVEPPNNEDNPFGTYLPHARQAETLASRLNWVIVEWTSPKGTALFEYLEEKSKEKISAEEWKKTILGEQEPTTAMIELVCKQRPYFAAWIVCGHDTLDMQVNPTSEDSVKRWKEFLESRWDFLLKNHNREI